MDSAARTPVLDIIQGKTAVAKASRTYALPPSEIEQWVDDGRETENASRSKLPIIQEQYEHRPKQLQEAYGNAMLELRARKNCSPCWEKTHHGRNDPCTPKVSASR